MLAASFIPMTGDIESLALEILRYMSMYTCPQFYMFCANQFFIFKK